ncbi:MAG TPA: dihydrolipoyl dehydrogenase [Alphaproteobacteria bacterium]|nr:dihydrolipoyl dehydrogenase [Alphaproteobacteria bacterium]
MAETSFDLIVVGGGPGGSVAAIRAAQLGLKTAVVEREHLGGICLNWGCIPTKALLRTSELAHLMGRADEFGLKGKFDGVDLKKVVKRSREVAGQLSKGVSGLLKKNKVAVVDGEARLDGMGPGGVRKLAVTGTDGKEADGLTAKNVILATGARARTLPDVEPDGKAIVTYKEAMVPESVPKKLLVVGSGAIGIEFASFYSDLGSEVTVVEVLDRILPVEDADISAFAHKAFEEQGMTIKTGAMVKSLNVSRGKVSAEIAPAKGESKAEKSTFDRVILAVGITGNVENLGLEGTRVRVEKGHIQNDKWGATGETGVYAIGDVAGPPWLAHKASHEGVACVEHIAGVEGVHPLDTGNVPGCTYCRPQVASVGLTEAEAKEKGHKVKVGKFPFIGNGKAIALGEPEGLVKTVFDEETGALLGAHMIGAEVTELIQGFAIARTLETTEAELMQTVFPHPTLSEMMHESTLAAFGRVIHI